MKISIHVVSSFPYSLEEIFLETQTKLISVLVEKRYVQKGRALYLQNREEEGGRHDGHDDARGSAKLVHCVPFTIFERLIDVVHELKLEV